MTGEPQQRLPRGATAVIALVLGGCVTATPYRPAAKPDDQV